MWFREQGFVLLFLQTQSDLVYCQGSREQGFVLLFLQTQSDLFLVVENGFVTISTRAGKQDAVGVLLDTTHAPKLICKTLWMWTLNVFIQGELVLI